MMTEILQRFRKSSLTAAIALAAIVGCTPAEEGEDNAAGTASGGNGSTAAPAETAPAAKSAETPVAAAGPAIVGTVKFEGERPQRAVLQTRADPKCEELHKDAPLLSKTEVVGENGELAYVFVYVSNPPEGDYAPPSEPVILTQSGCQYVPHVFGSVAGQRLEVHNNDPTLHNVRSFARTNRMFNWAQPVGSDPRSTTYKKAEDAIKFKCDVHPWMTAYMFVMDHPFFAVSGEDGRFEIDGLPPGDYELTAWHETYGEQTVSVTVPESGAAEIALTFSK